MTGATTFLLHLSVNRLTGSAVISFTCRVHRLQNFISCSYMSCSSDVKLHGTIDITYPFSLNTPFLSDVGHNEGVISVSYISPAQPVP